MKTGRRPKAAAKAGLKSLFQKSPLKNQAVHGATNYDTNLLSIRNTAVNPVIPVETGI